MSSTQFQFHETASTDEGMPPPLPTLSYGDELLLQDAGGLEASFRSEEEILGGCNDIEILYEAYLAGFNQLASVQNSEKTGLDIDSVLHSPYSDWKSQKCPDWSIDRHQDIRFNGTEAGLNNLHISERSRYRPQHNKVKDKRQHIQEMRQEHEQILNANNKRLSGGNEDIQDSLTEFTDCSFASPLSSSSSSYSSSSPVSPFSSSPLTREEFPPYEKWIDSTLDLLEPFAYSPAEGVGGLNHSSGRGGERALEGERQEEIAEVEEPLIYQEVYGNDGYLWRPEPKEKASNAVSQKVKTNSRKGERGPKIWEFLMRLLSDPVTNPELIRWEDLSSGAFILTQPGVIAQLWGGRASKPNLSANNFARSLRYHYSTGALTAVSERHYMYRCGPKALSYLALIQGPDDSTSLSRDISSREKQKKSASDTKERGKDRHLFHDFIVEG